jgi:hypothetical protein
VLEVSLHPQGAVRKLFRLHGHALPLLWAALKRLECGTILEPHLAQHKTFGLKFGQHVLALARVDGARGHALARLSVSRPSERCGSIVRLRV